MVAMDSRNKSPQPCDICGQETAPVQATTCSTCPKAFHTCVCPGCFSQCDSQMMLHLTAMRNHATYRKAVELLVENPEHAAEFESAVGEIKKSHMEIIRNVNIVNGTNHCPFTERHAKDMLARVKEGVEGMEAQRAAGVARPQIVTLLQSIEYVRNTAQSRHAMQELQSEAAIMDYALQKDMEKKQAALDQAKVLHQKASHNARVLSVICHHDTMRPQQVRLVAFDASEAPI